MNYEPNKIDWKIGDIVIHDADAKKEEMLMRIVIIKEELGKIVYGTKLFNHPDKRIMDKKYNFWLNTKEWLHDPKRFGIDTSKFTLLSQSANAESLISVKRESADSPNSPHDSLKTNKEVAKALVKAGVYVMPKEEANFS